MEEGEVVINASHLGKASGFTYKRSSEEESECEPYLKDVLPVQSYIMGGECSISKNYKSRPSA